MAIEPPNLSITTGDPVSPECRELINQLDSYLASLYPAESNHLLSIDELCKPQVTFLAARVGMEAVGCAAFVNWGDYAELKRLYVLPDYRGLKIGRSLLNELETRVKASGIRLARLETGVSQPEVLSLCEAVGYRRCGPFGNYRDDPLSVFMEKCLN
jgi:putative acetyltransferase